MSGLIIIDGPDAAGKTTLAKRLVSEHNGTYIHLTYVKDGMYEYQLNQLLYVINMSKEQLVVVDRHWMSEICYANAYRDGATDVGVKARLFQALILLAGGVYIYALPKDTTRHVSLFNKERETKGEMYSDVLPVIIEYVKLYEHVKDFPNLVHYDMFVDDYETIKSKAFEKLRPQQETFGDIEYADFIFCFSKNPKDLDLTGVFKACDYAGIPQHKIILLDYFADEDLFESLVTEYDVQPLLFGQTVSQAVYAKFRAIYGKAVVRKLNEVRTMSEPSVYLNPSWEKTMMTQMLKLKFEKGLRL